MTTKYTRVDVNQTDIDRALRKNSLHCVIATAIARSIDGASKVSVDLQTIRFTVGGERQIYLTPPAASGYVVAFDAGDPIHPFAFRLSERHKVTARKDIRTASGKERARVRASAKKAEQRAEKAQQLALVEPDPLRAAVAREDAEAARSAADAATAEKSETFKRLAGEPYVIPDPEPDPETGGPKRKPPPRAFQTGIRSYGQRRLRINQGPDTVEERAARAAVTAAYDVEG